MNEQNNLYESNNLKISDDVISTITSITSKEVSGVAELTPVPVTIKGLFKSKSVKNPVTVEINDTVAVIDVYLKVKYEAKVQDVAEEIQKRVKDAVQNMTGIAVSKVNVHVAGIVIDEKK